MTVDELTKSGMSSRASLHGRAVVVASAARQDVPERVLLWGLIAGLAWAPAYLGSNGELAWGVNAMLFPGMALAYEASLVIRGRSHPVGLRLIALPAVFFFAVVAWTVIQNATWMPKALQHPIWGMTADVLGHAVVGSISVDRDLTALALVGLITVGSVFWLALQLCRDSARAVTLLGAVAVIGVCYAVYGLAAFALTPGYTLWYENIPAKGFLTSTFYNKNSYATYAGMALCTMVGLTLRHYRRQAADAGVPFKYKLASVLEATGGGGALHLAGIFLILVTLLMTASRGAILSTTFGLIVIGAVGTRSRGRGREQRLTVFIGALLLAATFIGFGDEFLDRVSDSGVMDTARLAVAKMTIDSALNSPLFGYGLGTFSDVFPLFRDRSVSLLEHWAMAHDTYLEALQGLGLVFGTLLIAAVAMLAVKCLKGATTRHAHLTPSRVAVGVCLLIGLHSLVDFSLQIQAVALTFAAILGAGVAQSESSRTPTED